MLTRVSKNSKSIPIWARNGTIAYCRWDGGPLEVAKAHLSNWEYVTSPGAVMGMMQAYTDEGLQRLKEGGFNWVWLTWSAGFSYEQEEVQQAILRPFVKQCRQAGIHCTAYLSMCNLFVQDIGQHQPELLESLQRSADGEVIPYAAAKYFDKPLRLLGCLNHPTWKRHLRNRLKSAIEAGFEGAFYDNLSSACHCDRCQADFRAFARARSGMDMAMPSTKVKLSQVLEETAPDMDKSAELQQQQLLHAYWTDLLGRTAADLQEYANTLQPDFMVYCNWHVYHNTFGPPQLKALSSEDGQKTSYVGAGHSFPSSPGFEVRGYVSNAGLLKRMWAASEGWRPLRLQSHQTLGTYMEAAAFVPYSGSDWQRMIAECWVFRAAQEIFLEGNFMTELFCGAERAREAWESIGRYNRFQREHAALWGAAQTPEVSMTVWGRDYHPEADEDWQRTRFLTALALEGLQFDVVLNRQADARMLSRYPLLWLPSVEVVEDQELDILETYLREGGRLLATGVFAECEMIGRPRTQQARQRWIERLASAGRERWLRRPDWNDRGIWRGKAEIPAPVLEMREHFPTRVTCKEGPVIWTVWRCADGRLVVFLLNPDQRAPRHDVRVTVGHTSGQTRWHSPDADCGNAEIHNHADTVECRVSRLDIFGFLEIGGT